MIGRIRGVIVKKELREKVYNKCKGHCAYCGREITYKQMQVDHYWPQAIKHMKPNEDNNAFNNLMPSCAKCNNHKTAYRPEEWRKQLSYQVGMLKKSAQFDRALRFGQIEIKESPIVFYFERLRANGSTRTLGDFNRWCKPCAHCGYDPRKVSKKHNGRCWKCGRPVERDCSDRALKNPDDRVKL